MGASSSFLSSSDGCPMKLKLEDIPESCLAMVLSYLDPPEICHLARVNRAFRAASSSDIIWDAKLPSNYKYLVDRFLDEVSLDDLVKKDIFGQLCKHIPFDGGTKQVWVDKSTGGVCLSISAKALSITGIDDRRYWNHIPTDESRFGTIAYLQQIWWLQVDGDVDFKFPTGSYTILFRLQLGRVTKRLGRRVCNTENVHGWDIKPVQFQVTTSDGQQSVVPRFLENLGNWEYYQGGNFVIDKPNAVTNIKFSLTQIDCTHTKGGLCVDSVLICPSNLRKNYGSTF